MIRHYNDYAYLLKKNRGRKHEEPVSVSPDIWAHHTGDDVRFYFEPGNNRVQVATLFRDNSVTIDIHGWHTKSSCKIIEALSGGMARIHKGRIWLGGHPLLGNTIRYNEFRAREVPAEVVQLEALVSYRLSEVTVDDYPAKHRLMIELGTWKPRMACTRRVIAYVTGKCDKSELNPSELGSCMGIKSDIMFRAMETLL